jgi:hypothetical protein
MNLLDLRTYTKEELLRELEGACPGALKKFPPPEAFDITISMRNGKTYPAIHVGSMRRPPYKDLWLEEHTTPLGYPGVIEDEDLQYDYMGLYYATEDDVGIDHYLKDTKKFQGNDIFGKLSDSGVVGLYTEMMKALFRFVLVHCDKATEYEEFPSLKSFNTGLVPLVRGIEHIAKRTPQETEMDEQGGAETDGLGVSESAERNRKRALEEAEDDANVLTTDKRARSGSTATFFE